LIPLTSQLEGRTIDFSAGRQELETLGFVLGGNWDYDHGSLDRPLDEKRQVWLRLPFDVVSGKLDAEAEAQDTEIRFGTPYVLRHVYEEGLDEDAVPFGSGGVLDQFQDPADPDAPLSAHWREMAEIVLREAERRLGRATAE
jgi:hypothetical protein